MWLSAATSKKTRPGREVGYQNSHRNSHKQLQLQPQLQPQPQGHQKLSPSLTTNPFVRQLHQKNQQLGKAYQDLKAQFDELEDTYHEREEQLAQSQQDANKKLGNMSSPTKKSWRKEMPTSRPWSSSWKLWKILRNHWLQRTKKLLRKLTTVT